MVAWVCPRCQRRFGRAGQSYECAPAMSLEAYFATGPAHERPVFDDELAGWLTEAYLDTTASAN